MPVFHVYSRPGCHLCELLLEELVPLVRDRAAIEVVDIDRDPTLRSAYGVRIPVVEFEGEVLSEYRLDRAAVENALVRAEASGRQAP